jgi:hypothetical protein
LERELDRFARCDGFSKRDFDVITADSRVIREDSDNGIFSKKLLYV